MTRREHNPRRLDVERFATEQGELRGEWPLAGMARLAASCDPARPPAGADSVQWAAQGERRRRPGGGTEAALRLTLETSVALTCQRCLAPVETAIDVDCWFRFVEGEEQAAALDADSEDDVLASTRALDLQQLAEDELLLALPLVPRHSVCPQPLPAPDEAAAEAADAQPSDGQVERANPFAALAVLKRARH